MAHWSPDKNARQEDPAAIPVGVGWTRPSFETSAR